VTAQFDFVVTMAVVIFWGIWRKNNYFFGATGGTPWFLTYFLEGALITKNG
jgi:hypothetical protein